MKPQTALFLCFCFFFHTSAYSQGSLTPPAGPTPTMKTLDQVEARTILNQVNTPGGVNVTFIITQPGSYYLTNNISVIGPNQTGIQVNADNVTIDLNGFSLTGGGGPGYGIQVPSARTNLSIRNGSIRGWGGGGVEASLSTNSRYENLRASNNGNDGISGGDNCVMTKCSAFQNSNGGLRGGISCTIADCSARNNTGASAFGISVNLGSTVTNCSSANNDSYGIFAGEACSITSCNVYHNIKSGIVVASGCSIRHCDVKENADYGIEIGAGVDQCLVVGNNCSFNGAVAGNAGIHIGGHKSRIEGNHLCNNTDRGLKVSANNNIIFDNTASGQTVNYDIAAGNAVGPVVLSPSSAAISGSSGAASLGSTDPRANISF